MDLIDVSCDFRTERGNVVNSNEIVYAVMTVTNNLAWPLTNVHFQLSDVTGDAHLEPREDRFPKKIVCPDIGPSASATQEFVLKADNFGTAGATMKLLWDLAGTGLTYDLGGSISFPIHPS
jgi:hypothetical protein